MKAETVTLQSTVKAENRVPRWVLPLVKVSIVAADALLAAACFIFAFAYREGDPVLSTTAWASSMVRVIGFSQ